MLVQSAAMEVEQSPGPAGGSGPAGAKAPDRLAAHPNSTLIQASVGAAELQAALPLRPATRMVVPFLLHAPQVRPRVMKLRPGTSPCVHAPVCHMTRRHMQAGLCSGEEEAHLQVSLSYSAQPSTASKPLGRCLTLPLHLHVLPSLQVCTMH